MRLSYYSVLILLFLACNGGQQAVEADQFTVPEDARFQEIPASESGLNFANNLTLDANFDVFRYRNYYNGGGVGIGDLNNDGLPDVYMTANTLSNRLFLNQGDLKFKDVTEQSGAGGTHAWSTGVALADVNGDGWLDIYVCNSGDLEGNRRENELFINQQDGSFREAAAEYGLDDGGFSTHAVFFDYDKDGDLDCYVLNNSFRPVESLKLANLRNQRDNYGGDKLYRNDDGRFVDVSVEKNIYGSVIAFGLGITVGDVNGDGWEDIYVSNDFYERDYLYINQRNGNFSEELPNYIKHTSHFSMGADIGDINNDGAPEIFVTDMLAENLERIKQTTKFLTYDQYVFRIQRGFHYQTMRNSLQLNNGQGRFNEVGQLTGVAATDWSWGALIADLDNNGYKDIFVCNGIYKDVTDQDFIDFLANEENIQSAESGDEIDFENFVDRMPSRKIPNYVFANQGELQFEDVSQDWGFGRPTHSNGSAYADLDLDGDLDLIVNNVNAAALLYENQTSDRGQGHYLSFSLSIPSGNTQAVGSRITIYQGDEEIIYDHMPMKGFQSSMDYRITIGLGDQTVDSVLIRSPYGELIQLAGADLLLDGHQDIEFTQTYFSTSIPLTKDWQPLAVDERDVSKDFFGDLSPSHRENFYIDFDRDPLLYHMRSAEGPRLAVADNQDVYLPGSAGEAGQLLQYRNGRYWPTNSAMGADSDFEDTDALWFDADGDGDEDLLVLSGGNEYVGRAPALFDRLYLNEGGNFSKDRRALPRIGQASSSVTAMDVDQDGDQDLVVGSMLHNEGFGWPCTTTILENNGTGAFRENTAELAPVLIDVGLISRLEAADLDADGDQDLVLAGEFMPITLIYNEGGVLSRKESIPGSSGMYRGLKLADLNSDGRIDIVAGNLGLNSRFKASEDRPFHLYVGDFDGNGNTEQVFAMTEADGQVYPMALRHVLGGVMPVIKQRFTTYAAYQAATVEEVLTPAEVQNAIHYEATNFASAVYLQTATGEWKMQILPWQAQLSPVYAIEVVDLNEDGALDLILGGNFYGTQPEIGPYDASDGAVLYNNGQGEFFAAEEAEQLPLLGQVRDFNLLLKGGKEFLLVSRNSAPLQVLQLPN
ncbi:MAG: VCBS repeat-containing protein [Bacteroidota bacterium]